MVTDDLLRTARQHRRDGRVKQAVGLFQDVLRIDPAHDGARDDLLEIAAHLRGVTPVPQATPVATPTDTQSDVERRKYEKVWQCDDYRTFSPGLRGAGVVNLIDFFRNQSVTSILDAGCGSGKLMQKLITEYPQEFDVHGFDISANCLDPFFDGIRDEVLTVGCLWKLADYGRAYDGVICTDVMEHIPTERVSQTLRNLRMCTKKAGYLGIALFPDDYGKRILGEPLHLTVKEAEWWIAEIQQAGFQVSQHGVETTQHGQPMWLHTLLTVQ